MVVLPWLIYALVAVSGASGLMYEIVWIRALGLHFGTSTPSIALVTATFMAGLATGNAWLGARADRSTQPLALYARMELGIALVGGGVSLALLRGTTFFDGLSHAVERAGALAFFLRASVMVLLLLAPATLMGGTLPVLSRMLVRSGASGRVVGALYACNTLGAVVGVLVPDLWLIPVHGLSSVVFAAAAGNLLVAVLAWQMSGSATASVAVAPVGKSAATRLAAAAPARTLVPGIALTALSGFCGMALEVLWSRTLSHWTSALVTSFAILLAVYLLSFALGMLLTRRASDRTDLPLTAAGCLLALAALAAVASVAFAPEWRDFVRVVWPHALRGDGLFRAGVAALLHALYLEAPTCLLLGAAFPFVAKALVNADAAGVSSGRLFTINTLAGVLGSLIAAFVWLPTLGQQDSYLVVAVLLATGGGVAFLAPRGRGTMGMAAACLGLVLGAIVLLPGDRLTRAHFRSPERIVALREGATTTAAALSQLTYGLPSGLALYTPGVAMSDTSLGARRYMGMMAHAAWFAARAPKRALLVCFGVGNTARSLLSQPELQRLDVVDISREVIELAPTFATVQGKDPLADPRTHLFVDDGRHHLVARDATYDVITAEPPPPNHAGVVNLYSREFYALAKHRLAPHGVITQWLPVFQLSLADTRTIVAAFAAELPYAALLYGYNQHFILIGSPSPLAIDPLRATALVEQPSVRDDLARDAIAGASDIYGSVMLTDAELRAFVRDDEPLRDDHPTIEYPWQDLHRSPHYAALFKTNSARALTLLPRNQGSSALRASIASAARATQDVIDVVDLTGADAERRYHAGVAAALVERPGDQGLLGLLGLDTEAVALARRALAQPGAHAFLQQGAAQARNTGREQDYELLRDAAATVVQAAKL